MTGERDLRKLLRHMTPQLHPGAFVFCSFPDDELSAGLVPIATFREAEGLSAGVSYQFESGLITLTIHSSLDAVGFLVAVSAVLADAGIPCSVPPRSPFCATGHGAASDGSPASGGCCANADFWPATAAVTLKAACLHRRVEQ